MGRIDAGIRDPLIGTTTDVMGDAVTDRAVASRRRPAICACAALIVVAAAGVGAWRHFDRDIMTAAALSRAVRTAGPDAVRFDEITPFAWDRVFIFGPYVTKAEIERRLGCNLRGAERLSIGRSDAVCLVVFVRGDCEPACWFEFSRGEADLAWLARPEGHRRFEAVFRIVKDASGRIHLHPTDSEGEGGSRRNL